MSNTKHPIDNKKLVAAIDKLMTDYTPDNVSLLEKELRSAHFLAPIVVKKELDKNKPTLIEDGDLQFIILTNTEKEVFLPAFTDLNEMRKWNPDHTDTVLLTASDYNELVSSLNTTGVSINPYSQDLSLFPIHLEALQKIVDIEVDDTLMTLCMPKDPPLNMLKDIVKIFPTLDSIDTVYFFQTTHDNQISFVFIVDTNNSNRDNTTIKAFCRPYLDEEILTLQVSSAQLLEIASKQNPLYVKKRYRIMDN